MVKISAIVPVYNAQEYLDRCLSSICNQTLKDIEIICVDDCSTDDSLKILNNYAKNDSRIKVIHRDVNGGESRARNMALECAKGEFLSFVDNDDYLDLNFYEELYNKAIATNADIVKGEMHRVEYDGSSFYEGLNNKIRKNNNKFFFAYRWWTAIYKRELISKNNIKFIEGYPLAGDVLFLNQAIINCVKLELVDNVYYHYCRRKDSGDSKILSAEKIKSAIKIFEMIRDNIRNTGIKNTGMSFVVSEWLKQMLEYPYRTNEEDSLKYVLQKILDYYHASKDFIINDDEFFGIFSVVMPFIKNNDFNGIYNFYLKNNSPQKMRLAQMRLAVRGKISL